MEEFQLMKDLNHTNTVRVYGLVLHKGSLERFIQKKSLRGDVLFDFSLYYINTWENKLRRLNCVRPTECQWISLGLTLKTPRHSAVVSLIPDNLASCRPSNKSLQLENKQN